MFLKILKDELLNLLGEGTSEIETKKNPTILMLVGLQGSGKTTTIGKLGNLLRKKYNKKPLFVACDIYRPAAIEQLKTIGKELNIPVYEEGIKNPNEIVRNALEYAKENKLDYILIDTAGRLHVDEELMNELKSLNEEFKPSIMASARFEGKLWSIGSREGYRGRKPACRPLRSKTSMFARPS